jgi:hypothetical protein
MRYWTTILLVLSSALLSGCAGSAKSYLAKEQIQETFDSPAVMTIAMAKHYSGVLDYAFVPTSIPVDASGQFRSHENNWCEPFATKSSIDVTRQKFAELCRRHGGDFRGDFCVQSQEQDEVLFAARIRPKRPCEFGTEVVVIEPIGDLKGVAYINKLRTLGYKTIDDTQREKHASEILAAQRQREGALQESQRLAALPYLRKVGAKVCREQSGNTFVGFVENFTDEKLQIRMTNAFVTSVPSFRPTGFTPGIIWDYPNEWKLCN